MAIIQDEIEEETKTIATPTFVEKTRKELISGVSFRKIPLY